MAGVFLSWGGGEFPAMLDLKRELEANGFAIWEYVSGAAAGQPIHKTVLEAMKAARAAIFCFSDETANREWIEREAVMAYTVFDGDVTRILPVWIGPHPKNLLPAQIKDLAIRATDLYGRREFELRTFKTQLARVLDVLPPLEVPAALLAMTSTQAQALTEKSLAGDEARNGLTALCTALDMDAKQLLDLWRARYGPGREDFEPFPGNKMTNIVEVANRASNSRRTRNNERPLSIRWIHPDLKEDEAREFWKNAIRPMLIVDSVSTLHPDIREELGDFPDFSHAAVLWIPPYTHRTYKLEAPLTLGVRLNGRIGDVFRDWESVAAFETTTRLGAERWLQQTLLAMNIADRLRELNVAAIDPDSNTPRSINRYLAAGARK